MEYTGSSYDGDWKDGRFVYMYIKLYDTRLYFNIAANVFFLHCGCLLFNPDLDTDLSRTVTVH